ncbi:complement factor H-like [Tamandua tetradactyla]|uniref:complement factor H-like n=1 Tax=Tamandua tetradactyla TaxID=48850 RepID=UPI004053C8E9
MLFFINVILSLWVSFAGGKVKGCDLPQIKHGYLYETAFFRPSFPAAIGKAYYYYCNDNFVTPAQQRGDYMKCTKQGWSPAVPCLRRCYFHSVENGHSLRAKYTYLEHETVDVECNPGYSLPNEHTKITCTEQDWSPPPRCIRVETCLRSDITIENGFLSENEHAYLLNKQAQYKCKQGYVTPEGETTGSITCLQRGWSDQPTCIKSCDKPVFENAISKNNSAWFKLYDKLHYECNDGFETTDRTITGSIVCREDGWSSTPTCLERACGVPDLEQNLSASPRKHSYKVGDVLKLSCRIGLTIVGPDSIQCYHFGWSPNAPTCKGQVDSCGPPPQLSNGEIKERKQVYEHGEVVEYDCNPRYLIKGPKKIQCINGEWTALPICIEEERTCGDIPELEHGDVLSSDPPYHHGDSVNFNCRETFTMVGHRSITCIRGMWTTLPQCIATDQLMKCKSSRSVLLEANVKHISEFNHNTNLNYKCKGKKENKQSTCVNGIWHPELNCTEVKTPSCPPPPQIPNLQNITTTVNYQDGEKVSVLCEENYLLQGPEEIVCQDGRWQSVPRCVEKMPCSEPPLIEHGIIESFIFSEERKETSKPRRYRHGTTLRYTCEDGFRIAEEDEITCYMGRWNSTPRCAGIPCEKPPSIPQGAPSPNLDSYEYGQEVTYACNIGFGIDGPASIKCLGGRWPPPPVCKKTDCSGLPNVGNAILVSRKKKLYRSGEQLMYKCPEYFQLDGSNIVKCVNRNWIGSPKCRDISCVNPPLVENAHVISPRMDRYPPGERVRYECIKAFDLFGEVEVTCLNGTWTELPKCRDSKGKCGPPPPIKNGDLTLFPQVEYAPGMSVEYKCQAFYVLQGDTHATCRNGEWSEPPKCLEACVISEDKMNEHNIMFKWSHEKKLYSRTDDVIEFQCKYGYYLADTSAPLRTKCQEGTVIYPTCN